MYIFSIPRGGGEEGVLFQDFSKSVLLAPERPNSCYTRMVVHGEYYFTQFPESVALAS